MEVKCRWTEGMKFTSETHGHTVLMDTHSPIGTDSAQTPKELLLSAICGCTAMDVVALMKKYKQNMDSFEITASAEVTKGSYPVVFSKVDLDFLVKGNVDKEKLKEAVVLSQTKFCGVSAMVSKAVPIFYKVILNGEAILTDQSRFEF